MIPLRPSRRQFRTPVRAQVPRRARPLGRAAVHALGVLLLAVLLLALPGAGPAGAQDELYDELYWVRDVAAKGEGENDRAARNAAAESAAPLALDRLLRRLTPARDRGLLPPVAPERARALVRGLEVVRAERQTVAAGRSFDGALSYLFDPEAVAAFLLAEGIGWSARRSDPVLVLAVWRGEGGAVLWDDPNPWRDAWRGIEGEPGLVPVLLPEGSLKDLQAIDAAQAGRREAARLAAIAEAYGAKQVLVAEAGAGASGGLIVTAALFNLRSGAAEELDPLVDATGAAALAEAARALKDRLQERWKERVIVPEGPVGTMRVLLRFADLAAWVRIRGNLAAAPSVTGHRVIAFAVGEARLALSHRGDAQALAARLAAVGLVLQQESGPGQSGPGESGATRWVLGERVRAGDVGQ